MRQRLARLILVEVEVLEFKEVKDLGLLADRELLDCVMHQH
jgi:hypothetical protein